jgi:hypothetical protein
MSNLSFMQDALPLADSTMATVLFHSLLIVIGVSAVAVLLRLLPVRSAATNQFLWMLVLLPGVAFSKSQLNSQFCLRIPTAAIVLGQFYHLSMSQSFQR